MIKNRMGRTEWFVEKLEAVQHYKFNNEILENPCREEMTKLRTLLSHILGISDKKVNAKDERAPGHEQEHENAKKHKVLTPRGHSDRPIKEEKEGFSKQHSEFNADHKKHPQKPHKQMDLNINSNVGTEFVEFNIGRRTKKQKGEHKVVKFIDTFKTSMANPHFKPAANMPLKKLFNVLAGIYEEKFNLDLIQKYTLAEFTYDI
mmetsp:Transcript_98284/g.211951  ORF Transcript_98284/g.211951 Transcript_98284/m.211951 type:complete len:204 (+) Transcript_98284:2076-2687(+)